MNQQKVYNLEEFATKYHIKDIYGAYAAYFSVSGFNNMVKERTLFTKILLVKQGSCRMLLQQTIGDEQSIQLTAKDLLIITPKEVADVAEISKDFQTESILVDETFADHATRYQLTANRRERQKHNGHLPLHTRHCTPSAHQQGGNDQEYV